MAEWVAVCGEENEEAVEIPCEPDGQGNVMIHLLIFNFKHLKVFLLTLRIYRLPIPGFCHCPVPRGDWSEVPEPRDEHFEGCEATRDCKCKLTVPFSHLVLCIKIKTASKAPE